KTVLAQHFLYFLQGTADEQFVFIVEKKTGVIVVRFATDDVLYLDNMVTRARRQRDSGNSLGFAFQIALQQLPLFREGLFPPFFPTGQGLYDAFFRNGL